MRAFWELSAVVCSLALPAVYFHRAPMTTVTVTALVFLVIPVLLEHFLPRVLFSCSSCLTMLRLMQVAAGTEPEWRKRSVWFRAMFLLAMHDLRDAKNFEDETVMASSSSAAIATAAVKPVRRWLGTFISRVPRLAGLAAGVAVRFAASLVLYASMAVLAEPPPEATFAAQTACLALRTVLGAVCMLLWLDVIDLGLSAGYLLFGLRTTSSTQNKPLLATSVTEFWQRRWNREMHALLKASVYVPCRRMLRVIPARVLPDSVGREAAVILTFAISGWLHSYVYLIVGPHLNHFSSAMVFFLVQPAAMWVERRCKQSTWPRALQRVWTLSLLLCSFPLLGEPMQWLLPPQWLVQTARPGVTAATAALVAGAAAVEPWAAQVVKAACGAMCI